MYKKAWIPYGIVVVLLVLAIYFDYPLTDGLFGMYPIFALFFERIILIPIQLLVVFTFCMQYVKYFKRYYLIFAIISALYVGINALYYWIDFRWYWYVVAILCAMFIVWGMIFYLKQACSKWVWTYEAFFKLFTCVLLSAMLITTCLKEVWGRVRYRDLVSFAQFTPWFLPQGVNHNFSFPSGHMCTMSTIICFLQWKRNYYEKISKWRYVTIIVLLFCMAISRMMLGAHFLSDITIGFTITYSCYLYWKSRIYGRMNV